MKSPSPDEFADAMTKTGHLVFRCSSCHSVLWLEADNTSTLEGLHMMRYGEDSMPDDCTQCSKLLGGLAEPGEEWFKIIEILGSEEGSD